MAQRTSVDELVRQAIADGRIGVDPESGIVTARNTRINNRGYRVAYVGNERYGLVQRIVWIAAHGSIPEGMVINHKNGDTLDNRIANLETTTQPQNLAHGRGMAGLREASSELDLNSMDQDWLASVLDAAQSANVTGDDVAALKAAIDAA